MDTEQLETELSILAGKTQALTHLCLALAITHPDPKQVLLILDNLGAQAKAQVSTPAFQHGIDSIQQELKTAIATLVGTHAMQQLSGSRGH